ncbi:SemiSWEET family sugar transporter [Tessaracoccus sp.]
MPVETALALTASSFGVVMGASPVLQIRKMLTERSSRDVSLGYFTIIALGSILWSAYALSIPNVALLIPNIVGLTSALSTLVVAYRLRSQERHLTGEVSPPANPLPETALENQRQTTS